MKVRLDLVNWISSTQKSGLSRPLFYLVSPEERNFGLFPELMISGVFH